MRRPRRGEVWLVDLGLAAKIRPCLVLGVPAANEDRALVTIVPHTTSLRGTRYEVSVPAPYLRPGAFDTQGIVTVPVVRLMRQMGTFSAEQLHAVISGVCLWLGIQASD
ncbi:MAG: type II toxin-antitoxin system PemK/MazF family toxin [Gammaproteobacteria bacterium]